MQYVTYICAPVIAYQIRSYPLLWTMSFFWYHWTMSDLAHRGVPKLHLQLNSVPQLATTYSSCNHLPRHGPCFVSLSRISPGRQTSQANFILDSLNLTPSYHTETWQCIPSQYIFNHNRKHRYYPFYLYYDMLISDFLRYHWITFNIIRSHWIQ